MLSPFKRTLMSLLTIVGMVTSPMAAFAQGSPVSIGGPFEGEASALTGAGATFPAPLYQKWFDEYAKLTHVNINYQAIGSGAGINGIQDQTVDFGAALSGIFLGDISSWNDPHLVADKPVLAKLDQPIVLVHPSDGSGTTFGFTDYLSSVS